jgi:hypothetical protein
MANWDLISSKNLDVPEREIGSVEGTAGASAPAPLLSSLCANTAEPSEQPLPCRRYRVGGSKYITVPQATNIVEAVHFSKSIGLPLVAHLTIHWAYTNAGDDPDGKRFAKVREGLAKWLHRHGIVFACAWSLERLSNGQAEVVHVHMLFHLPPQYCVERKLQIEAAIFRLIERHGGGYWADEVIRLTIWPNPDGKYLIKGGGPKVWNQFRLRKEHRRLQGLIHCKRCGTTQNIGRAARRRALQRGAM